MLTVVDPAMVILLDSCCVALFNVQFSNQIIKTTPCNGV